ncbi:MAG: radical SAM protein [Dehalogenimonas sp.]
MSSLIDLELVNHSPVLGKRSLTNPTYKNTRIYHISYTPETKEVSLFFWGCNFTCKGCLSKKETNNFLLEENLRLFSENPFRDAPSPERFLSYSEVLRKLEDLDIKAVLFEGQEAGLDPAMPELARWFHQKYQSRNVLCTNGYRLPSLEDIDWVQLSIKAINDDLHRDYTGKSNERVLRNFIDLNNSGVRLSVATVLIPDYIESDEIKGVAKFISCVNKDIPYTILPYFKSGDNPWRRPTPDEMDEAAEKARKFLNRVHAWHGTEELKYEVKRIV